MSERVKWRMEKMCDNCPFDSQGPGLHLRKSLGRRRWLEITKLLRMDGHFHCHKTTPETGNGTNLLCAGSLAWQEKHLGYPGQLARIMERLSG